MKLLTLTILLLLSATSSFAEFCPTNFNQINPGDSVTAVQLQCGTPTSQKTYKAPDKGPQEWAYYVHEVPGQNGTIKMLVAFNDDKVINLSVNGAGITNTKICGATAITLGETPKQITSACGKPVYINKSATPENTPKPVEITELTYNGTTTIILMFKDGKYTGRKQ